MKLCTCLRFPLEIKETLKEYCTFDNLSTTY
ncbi:hypothetical protein Gohar_027964, partial [Gossypium harknessii]|nr:hypothetical protein [Gossypium harknessii]